MADREEESEMYGRNGWHRGVGADFVDCRGCIVPFILIVGGVIAGVVGLGSLFV
jgi:hypothetical protein